MVWGVSGSDLKISGWNTAVGVGVVAGCAVAALLVKTLAFKVFAKLKQDATSDEKIAYTRYSQLIGLVVGLGAAAAAYRFVPASRFALVTDVATDKVLKIGVVQAVAGFVLDSFTKTFPIGTVVGLGCAAATRFGNLALAGLGAVGAVLGSGLISKPKDGHTAVKNNH